MSDTHEVIFGLDDETFDPGQLAEALVSRAAAICFSTFWHCGTWCSRKATKCRLP